MNNLNDTDTYSFLRLVAKDLVSRFGNRPAGVTVVFPSRRARLFFNNYLYREVGSPLWAPQYTTIEELFENHSAYRIADSIQLTGDLYRSYLEVYNAKSEVPSTETLDEFFFFGEILLNDFDDIDKNLVNARAIFTNLRDLDQMKDDFSHLSEEQLESISRHFGKIFKDDSPLKTAFRSIWNILGDVYQNFREKLKERGVAYQGMLMRDVIENDTLEFPGEQYAFVGFNVLNKCEENLFKRLKNKALFYWDYDAYYLNYEAGRYIAGNIRKFGSALEDASSIAGLKPEAIRPEFNSFLSKEKEITFLASSSESGQSGVIPAWIDSLKHSPDYAAPDSAIVLCNEDILPVVMHTISPEKVENVNITMGFPITQTPIADFLQILAELQTKGMVSPNAFHYKYVLQTLRHPYTRIIFPEAKETEKNISRNNIFFPDNKILNNELLFTHTHNATGLSKYLLNIVESLGKAYKAEASFRDIYDGLYQESVFRAYQILNRLYGLMSSGEWTLEKPTFLRLLRRLLSVTQVPFHGEPLKGLQIMGVLETRALDFKNLLILSVNEGFMPGNSNENTFIPQFLRSHLGLSTGEHQDSIYAYYFYRLLQRAEKITLVYNTDKTQTGKAEMSRFLLQMLVDPRLNIRRYTLQPAVKPMDVQPVIVPKTDEVMRLIKEKYDFNTNPGAKPLTPSNLNIFIDCSLRFYLQKIKAYETPDELSDELDSSIFGTIFHHAAECLYREVLGITGTKPFNTGAFVVQKERLDVYLQPGLEYKIRKFVSKAFDEVYFKGKTVDESQYNGEQLINFRVICKMLERLIEFDRRRAPFTIHGLEWKNYEFVELPEQSVKLKIGGIIDRLEEHHGKLLIMDYKTGSSGKTYKTLEDLVTEKDKRASHIFQTFVYASVLIRKKMSELPIVPALLYMQDAGKENFSPVIEYEKEPIEDFRNLNKEFEGLYIQKISDLFNRDIPFRQTTFESNCAYCEFRELCNR
ncbi:MAG: PD-(D/E)XK nuclease family protein [Dysgonamonadaceae bacterium]|jgi:CRISPR/Cas system-associated exonuclease Cas4 (RecB family)|nr:PD-(D/E)XK nuclease family protein [Dysgonamonadaceae bacterium]